MLDEETTGRKRRDARAAGQSQEWAGAAPPTGEFAVDSTPERSLPFRRVEAVPEAGSEEEALKQASADAA